MDSDFSTLVLSNQPTYNPTKKQEFVRSSGEVRARKKVALSAQNISRGSHSRIDDFCPWASLRQLLECVYLPAAAGEVRSVAAFGVSQVWKVDRAL